MPETDSVAMLLALDSFRSESLPDVGLQKAFKSLMYHRKAPATDRIVAGIKADGVGEVSRQKLRIPGDDQFFDALAKGVALAADDFAKQLREGDDK
ncbi:Uncharacterised protein [Klebsiella pneumoniae]|uniref:Uncharacterized protein n=1 Tax=Klebsiella pneumoniae TaxID=573 RepID=A0A2X3H567_KLEPN|nr:Uncharacterised protein [Klebsiella pneumoniae]